MPEDWAPLPNRDEALPEFTFDNAVDSEEFTIVDARGFVIVEVGYEVALEGFAAGGFVIVEVGCEVGGMIVGFLTVEDAPTRIPISIYGYTFVYISI